MKRKINSKLVSRLLTEYLFDRRGCVANDFQSISGRRCKYAVFIPLNGLHPRSPMVLINDDPIPTDPTPILIPNEITDLHNQSPIAMIRSLVWKYGRAAYDAVVIHIR